MNQNEDYGKLAAALVDAYREAAKRHDEATKPKPPAELQELAESVQASYGPSMVIEKQAPPSVHRELACDYRAIANAIERHAAKETEA
ncbi:MAG: hypothetical protein OXQ31_14320 [Spirochaetaceae bacterium]|nr:hypothetical protein [Spirochaetaceae bacterium]